jgi:hypothetical protein
MSSPNESNRYEGQSPGHTISALQLTLVSGNQLIRFLFGVEDLNDFARAGTFEHSRCKLVARILSKNVPFLSGFKVHRFFKVFAVFDLAVEGTSLLVFCCYGVLAQLIRHYKWHRIFPLNMIT